MKKYRKHGFTLIEVVIYLFIVSTLFLMLFTFYRSSYNFYNTAREEAVNINNVRNFFINLDIIMRDEEIENIYEQKNCLNITKNTHGGKMNMVIKRNENSIFIKYIQNGRTITITKMLNNVKEFNIKTKDNLIYLHIITLNEREYIRCL